MSGIFNGNFLENVAETFDKVVQLTKETIGQAERTQESPEFQEQIRILKDTRVQLNATYDAAKKYYRRQQEANKQLENLATALDHYVVPDTNAQDSIHQGVPITNQARRHNAEFLTQYKQEFVDPLAQLIEGPLDAAWTAWKQVENTRLAYDAAITKFRKLVSQGAEVPPSDIEAAQTKADNAEKAYELAKDTATQACNALAEAKADFAKVSAQPLASAFSSYGKALSSIE